MKTLIAKNMEERRELIDKALVERLSNVPLSALETPYPYGPLKVEGNPGRGPYPIGRYYFDTVLILEVEGLEIRVIE